MGQQGRSMTRRSRLWLALPALAGLAAAAAPAAGASEGLCLVTNDGGAPATTSVVGVATDGTQGDAIDYALLLDGLQAER